MARRTASEKGLVPQAVTVAEILGGTDGYDELLAASEAADAIGRKPKPGISASGVDGEYRAFVKVMDGLGVSVDDIKATADLDAHGYPIFPVGPLQCWVVVKLATSTATADSLINGLNCIIQQLRSDRWATVHLTARHPDGVGKKIRNQIRSGRIDTPKPNKKKARPIFVADLDDMADQIVANPFGWTPLCVAAQKAWTVVSWYMVGRPGEYSYRLRWKHVDLEDLWVTVPPYTFKTNRETLQSEIPHRSECKPGNCHRNCAVDVLRSYRQTLIDHGVPVDGEALVWPTVRTTATTDVKNAGTLRADRKFGDALFVADPMSDRIAAAKATGDDEGVAQGDAESQHSSRYRERWDKVAAAIDFTVENDWQRVAPHGMRRGGIQTIIRNGGTILLACQRAGHAALAMTGEYTTTDPVDTSMLMAGEITPATPAAVTSRQDLPKDCEPAPPVTCQVPHKGKLCGNKIRFNTLTIDGNKVRVCGSHYRRFADGLRGDELTKPIAVTRPPTPAPTDRRCQLPHNGTLCDNTDAYDMGWINVNDDGTTVDYFVCGAHLTRWRKGKQGDALTKPIDHRFANRKK